jgi:splicing factor 3B subunit 1
MIPMTPEQRQVFRWEREIDERNRPLTDDELDAIMPKDGYKVCNKVLSLLKRH